MPRLPSLANRTPDSGEDIAGTCFGFGVRSSLDLQFLRHGDGEPLWVSGPSTPPDEDPGELVQRWLRTTEAPFETNLYRDQSYFRLQMADSAWFHIDPERPSVVVPE